MPIEKRTLLPEGTPYFGLQGYKVITAGYVLLDPLVVEYHELTPGRNATQYKICLVIIDVTAIVGTWDFKIATDFALMQAPFSATTRHNPAGTLNVTGNTTTGKKFVGYNLYTAVNCMMGDRVFLEIRNTAGASPSLTLSVDAELYN